MKRLASALAVLVLCGAADAQVYDNGAPDYLDGNEMTQWTQAEDFMLGSAVTLSGAKFSLLDTTGGLVFWDGSLDWWIYTDGGGVPGAVHASGSAQNLVTIFDQNVGGWDFYDFVFDFGGGGVAVAANTTYWLALHAAADWQNRDNLYWTTTSPNGTLFGMEDNGGVGSWISNGNEHSFQLYAGPAPGALALFGLMGLVSRRRR